MQKNNDIIKIIEKLNLIERQGRKAADLTGINFKTAGLPEEFNFGDSAFLFNGRK